MGNCCSRCFGALDRRGYIRSKYTAENDFSIENYYLDDAFENLMDEEPHRNEMTRLLTDREQQLLRTKQFDVLVHDGRILDAELETKLAAQEQEISREEEEFYEAKREAAQIAKLNRDRENSARNHLANSKAWVNDDEWDIAGGEDDFEIFLASVKARSLATRTQVKNGSGDAQSSSSSNAHTKEKSLTEGSSIDLSWDHETEVSPQHKVHARVSEDSWSKQSTASPMHSSDLEWDPDFVSAEDTERTQLLNAASNPSSSVSR